MRIPTQRTEIVVPMRTILLLVGVFFLAWALVAVSGALLLIFTGVFLGLVLEHPTRIVERRLRTSRGLSATIVVLGALVGVTVLALLMLVPIVEGVRDYLRALPDLVAQLRDSQELGWAGDSAGAAHVQSGAEAVAAKIPQTVSAVLGVTDAVFGVALAIVTVTFTALFFLGDIGRLRRAAATVMTPDQESRWLGVWERITETVSRWAVGVLVVGAIAGVVQGITAWLLGSGFALALGILAGALDAIPNIGATVAGFILSLTLLAEEGLTAAIVMLVVVLIYQQVENNLVTPTVQGKATNISGFFVITGVTVFGALLGVLGALVAVPVTATIQIIVQELTAERRERMAALRAAAAVPPA